MIKFNNSDIIDWNFDDSNIIKVYHNGAVCYYKITSGDAPTPTAQTPCYAVVNDISQYSSTEFVDVYDKATEKWYKLNNLNAYEEYGIYGSGRTITYYEGKLTIDGDYEYQYSGGSWVNVGEISGSSITIKSPEYIAKTSSYNTGQINLGYTLKDNTKFQIKIRPTSNGGGACLGEISAPSDSDDYRIFWYSNRLYYDYGSDRKYTSQAINNTYEYEVGNYYVKNLVTSATVLTGTTKSGTATSHTRNIYAFFGVADYCQIYYLKIYEGDTLVKDFIPWTDMNGNYGFFDKVSLTYIQSTNQLTASTTINDVEVGGGVEYPIYYDEIQDPPNNVTFTSMTEAESYECPWVGMTGIISNTDYLFCNTYTWLTKYSYQEVSGYLCESGNKYKKLQEYDRQLDGTMSATTTYVKGDLIEIHSSDCPQCTVNFCGVDANGNTVTVNNGTSTLSSSNWTSPYPVNGEVGAATTTIGAYCFSGVKTSLSALTIGNTVTTIEHEAFMETSLITTLTIPSSVTQIDFWAFTRCNGLNEVIFEGTTPPTFTNQHDGVFHDYCPPVIYVPDEAVSAYRAIDSTVWTNETWSSDIIQPISNK